MPPPSSVTVALSAEESRSLREAADVLALPPEKVVAAAAVAFARLCGFRKMASSSVRREPGWGPRPESEFPAEILEIALDPETMDQVTAAAAYVRWEQPEGPVEVTLPEYVVGAAIRLIQETRDAGPPPSFRGLADQLFAPTRGRGESAFRASLGTPGLPVVPPPAEVPLASPPAAGRPTPPAPRPERPAYTLPRPERRPPEARRPPPGRRNGSSAKPAPPPADRTKGKPQHGAPPSQQSNDAAPPSAKESATAGATAAAIAWLRRRPMVLAGAAAGVLLVVVVVSAYLAATAPPDTARRPPPQPTFDRATLDRPAVDTKGPAVDVLRLDAPPADGETAALALKRWEAIAPAGADVPASTKNHGKNIDALLAERYGRPRLLADASLKPEAYDADIASAVADVARIYPVPPALVKAVIRRESNYNPNALSQVGAIGLMQLMPYTAKKVGLRVSDLWVPKKNILGGTRLLSALLQYYDGDVISALTAYNARPREPLAPLPKNGETPEYVAAVLRFFEEYNGGPLHPAAEPNPLDAPLRPGR